MLPSTAFVPSSAILENSRQQYFPHVFFLATSVSVPRSSPKHLRLRNDDDDGIENQNITKNGDDLFLPTAIFLLLSTFASVCTIWSEYSVLISNCGPRSLPDALERGSYLSVLAVAGLSVLVRIVSGGQSLSEIYTENTSKSGMNYDLYVSLVEKLSLLAVVGAFVALAAQSMNGEQMDGLSGVNIDMCRAMQQSLGE